MIVGSYDVCRPMQLDRPARGSISETEAIGAAMKTWRKRKYGHILATGFQICHDLAL